MKPDLSRAAALSVLLAGIFCHVYGRTDLQAWEIPVHYGGDTVSFLAYLKAARDGHVVPVAATFVPDLNAPYEANWNDYPRPQKAFFFLAGLAARALGLFPTANLLLLLAHLGAGLAFFGVARYLRVRPGWAAAGAVAFACSPYIFYRHLSHLALSLYWHIPLDVLVVGWCFRRYGLRVRSRRFAFALAVAVVTALFNVYYAALFVQLLVLCAAAQALRGAWRKAAAPLLLSAGLLGILALESLGTLLHPLKQGRNLAAVHRTHADLARYALMPIELVLPAPGNGLLLYGDLADVYWQNAHGEIGSAYLGLAAVVGLAWLLGGPLVALVRGRRVVIPQAAGAVAWILAFSVAGGINSALGILGFVLLRGTNRYSVWLAAIGLLVLVGRLSRASPLTRRRLAWPAPLAFTVLVLVDQAPGRLRAGSATAQRERVEKDRAFARRVETSLPGHPMLFMLPVLDFPEGGGVRQMPDYDHFRPYLFTSRVRYSYGTDKGRSREGWQRRVEAMPPVRMVERLEGYGFSGVVVDRRGYPDRGHALLSGFAEAGRTVAIDEGAAGRAFVRLRPRAPARLPENAPRLGEGWYGRPQAEGYWARTTLADWIVDNGSADEKAVTLSFELTVAKPRTVTLSQAGRVVASWQPNPSLSVTGLRLVLPPGDSRLVLATDRPPDVVEIGNRLRIATFAVKDLEMKEE
jgi:hypothetical protein